MGNISEAVTVVFAAVMVGALGFEINRRRKRLRDLYDVLDHDSKHIAAELEGMIELGELKPFTGDEFAW